MKEIYGLLIKIDGPEFINLFQHFKINDCALMGVDVLFFENTSSADDNVSLNNSDLDCPTFSGTNVGL